eukprot:329974_1
MIFVSIWLFLVPLYTSQWTPVLVLPNASVTVPSAIYSALDVGATEFNRLFNLSSNYIIWRECPQCNASHQNVYYRRFTDVDTFDMYSAMNVWTSAGNAQTVDFNLYSTLGDAINNTNPWANVCNFDDTTSVAGGVGAFRDCGPTTTVVNNWCGRLFTTRECRFSIHILTLNPTTSPSNNPSWNPTIEPSAAPASPAGHPTFNLIGHKSNDSDLFVIPNTTLTFSEAETYCNTFYHSLANVYDPKENDIILQLVNYNYITHAFIGYYKEESQWRWKSNVSSNPLLWLQTPLAQVTANVQSPTTGCVYVSRYGWQYTECDNPFYFVCETRNHTIQFTPSSGKGAFMMSDRKLKFDYARSVCRAQYGNDLATIYEEEEYAVAQSLCASNTTEQSNCWIGYQRIETVWGWVQDIPTSAIPTNRLINVDIWSIYPWQKSVSRINC